MKAWEIWSYQPEGWPEPHPAVIISGSQRVANKPDLNVLLCTSQRANRAPLRNEVILDQADGLEWQSLCKCDLIHLVTREELSHHRGTVTAERRRQIIAAMIVSNEWV